MQAKIHAVLVACGTLAAVAASARDLQRSAYVVVESFPLPHLSSRIESAVLQLLLDQRLTVSVRQELWGKGGWPVALAPASLLHKQLSAVPPAKARLIVKDSKGRLLAHRDLQAVLAALAAWSPSASDEQLFLLTEDFSTEAGSYNGLRTTLLQVGDSSLHDVRALNTTSRQEESILLWKSLKSDWRMTRREDQRESLAVSCHPTREGQFMVEYARYSLEGGRWLSYRREVDGFWESDAPFPNRSEFP